LALCCAVAQQGSAQVVAGLALNKQAAGAGQLIEKAHGFHCRREYGWDPAAGVYRYHRHEGICRDYERCLRQQRACILLLGRGLDRWTFESFGFDNWRFSSCMIRRGCY
jgi:hypothetical protein